MKLTQLSVLAVVALAAHGAFAQSSGDPRAMTMGNSASGSSMGSSGGSSAGSATGGSDASSVTNAGSAFASDTTTNTTDTTTTTGDITPTGEMANTGGEPELMLLAGIAIATGGLLLRRKASAFNL